MKPVRAVLLIAGLGAVFCIGLARGVTTVPIDVFRVYAVAAVLTRLAHDPEPEVWLNRTLLVRGIATAQACMAGPTAAFCGPPRFMLRDPDPRAAATRLDLTWTDGDSLPAVLRGLPMLGLIFPAPQAIQWDRVAVYRVQLRIEHPCSVACDEAVLLDAMP
jgi:hypothetical protein